MARRPFAGTPADYVIDATGKPLPGMDEGGNVIVSGQAYDAATGGNLITDLQTAAGEPLAGGTIIPDQQGKLPRFLGPDDGTAKLWVDFGAGTTLLLATDDPDRITTLETGGVQASGQQYPATAVVYASDYRITRPVTNAGQFTWTCDGTADETEINAAINAVHADGGGSVLLLGGTFNIAAAVQMRTAVTVTGVGFGTRIRAASNFQTGMITLFDNATHLTHLSNLTLDGQNRQVHGIHYTANGGQIFTAEPASNPDPAHIIRDLFIYNTGDSGYAGHGMRMTGGNLRAGKYDNIRIQNATGCGVWIEGAVDSHYTNIDIGSSGSGGPAYATTDSAPVGHGIYINGDQNSFLAVKTWFSRGAGFLIRAVRCRFTACEAQDNYSHGFEVQYGQNSFLNCHADSNGQVQTIGGDATGRGRDGFRFAGLSTTAVGCMAYDRAQGDHTWTQNYGFNISTGMTNSRVVGCITYGNSLGSVTGGTATNTTVDVRADSNGR